jgi:hypothetical protein
MRTFLRVRVLAEPAAMRREPALVDIRWQYLAQRGALRVVAKPQQRRHVAQHGERAHGHGGAGRPEDLAGSGNHRFRLPRTPAHLRGDRRQRAHNPQGVVALADAPHGRSRLFTGDPELLEYFIGCIGGWQHHGSRRHHRGRQLYQHLPHGLRLR